MLHALDERTLLDDLAHRVLDGWAGHGDPTPDPGPVVLASTLAPDDPVAARAARAWLSGLRHTANAHPGLFGGLAGQLAGLRLLASVDPSLERPAASVAAALRRSAAEHDAEAGLGYPDYDLVAGPAGVLLAHCVPSARPGETVPFAARLAELCADGAEGLRCTAYEGHELPGWVQGRVNAGLAHGVPGVAVALAASLRAESPGNAVTCGDAVVAGNAPVVGDAVVGGDVVAAGSTVAGEGAVTFGGAVAGGGVVAAGNAVVGGNVSAAGGTAVAEGSGGGGAAGAAPRAGSDRDAVAAALGGLARWLAAEAYRDDRGILTWPTAGGMGPPARSHPRQAWCCGCPGAAWALWEAGTAPGGPGCAFAALGAAAMRSLCENYDEDFHLCGDTASDRLGVCHGAAGVLAVADAFVRHAGLVEAGALRRRLAARLRRHGDEVAELARTDVSLLTGASGVLAALRTASGAARGWLPVIGLR